MLVESVIRLDYNTMEYKTFQKYHRLDQQHVINQAVDSINNNNNISSNNNNNNSKGAQMAITYVNSGVTKVTTRSADKNVLWKKEKTKKVAKKW